MMTQEQELGALKHQAKYLERALEQLRDRIREVDSSAADSKTK
jgi:prefoldin subunit 5